MNVDTIGCKIKYYLLNKYTETKKKDVETCSKMSCLYYSIISYPKQNIIMPHKMMLYLNCQSVTNEISIKMYHYVLLQ